MKSPADAYYGECPVEVSIQLVGDISNKVLTENLRALEQDGIVQSINGEGRHRYGVTASGERLMPILHALGEWAEQHTEGAHG